MTLNARQRAFVRAYTSGKTLGNGRHSARKAGYNGSDETLDSTAYDLLRHPEVSSAIAAREQDAEDASIADRYEREQFLTSVMRGEITEAKVVGAGENSHIVDAEPAVRDRLKALELHGKMHAEFVERKEVSGKGGGPVELGYSKDAARAELERRVRERYGDKADEVLELFGIKDTP